MMAYTGPGRCILRSIVPVRPIAVLALALSLTAQTARDLAVERRTTPAADQRARWAVVIGVASLALALGILTFAISSAVGWWSPNQEPIHLNLD